MKEFLFIGNFLSKKRGTVNPTEQIITKLGKEHFSINKSSSFENKILRFIDIVLHAAFKKYLKMHVDVFSGNAFIFTLASVIIASIRKKPFILTLHGGKLPEYYNGHKVLVNIAFKKASLIQSPSLFLKNFFEHQGYQVSYLPNPIALELFPYKRDQVKQYSLLWVRAFTSIYNPEVPVRVLCKLVQIFPEATLTMVGPDKGELVKVKKLTQELNLSDKVTFTGPIPNNLLYSYYQTHQVYLNTTSYESFGVAVVEAAACGIPIVSNKVGEIPFIWTDQENILLVEENNVDQYLEKIIRLFKDIDKVQEISENARKKAEEFDWKKINSHWDNLFSSLEQ